MPGAKLEDEAGYSLIEVVVAILLLSIAIIPMVSMFDAGLRSAVLGSNYDTARTTAAEQLEEIKALPYEDVVADYPPGGSTACGTPTPPVVDDCTVKTDYASFQGPDDSEIKANSGSRSMMQIEVTVEWDGGDYTTTGLLAEGSV